MPAKAFDRRALFCIPLGRSLLLFLFAPAFLPVPFLPRSSSSAQAPPTCDNRPLQLRGRSQPRPASASDAQLTGILKDPAGYLVGYATLTLTPDPTPAVGSPRSTSVHADSLGSFRFAGLQPGTYILTVQAAGFAPLRQNVLVLSNGDRPEPRSKPLDLVLQLLAAETHLEVSSDDDSQTLQEHNGAAIVLRPSDLATLADDPDTMRRQLEMIAGPSPDGVRFFIDGFESTRLPHKSNIREIRINSNLYSAQYDTSGQGRVEVFTRPGAGTLHGGLSVLGETSYLNAQDPFAPQPPYASTQYNAYLNGPLGKRLSSNVNFYRIAHNDSAIIDATTLDSNLNPVASVQAIPNSRTQTLFSPRFDFQAPHNTALSLRYTFLHDAQAIGGVGGLALATQAYRVENTNQTLQLLATRSFGAKTVNEVRLQYTRTRNQQIAASNQPTISVQGAFVSGGAPGGTNRDNQDIYELQDYFSHVFKRSFLRAGGRLRSVRDANLSMANFNGSYIFPSLAAYRITLQGQAQGLTAGQIRTLGGGPGLFSLTIGTPSVAVSRTDGALYLEQDWKVTSSFGASLGLRIEGQNIISDHLDAAPRASLNYTVGREGKLSRVTLRTGAGLFYQRFSTLSQLRAARQNGVLQGQFQVSSPDFYPFVPTAAALGTGISSSTYRIGSSLRAPVSLYTGLSIEHTLGKNANIALSYSMTHQMHAFEIRNINAPLPGTFSPGVAGSGTRPIAGRTEIYEYGSEGVSNQHALRLNGGYRRRSVSFYAYYSYTFNNADTAGAFPSNSYNQHADYGRSENDLRHQLYFYLNATLPLKLQLNTSFLAHSGAPFNIVLGQDLNGDTQFNDRPAFATDLTRPSVVLTRWGAFDTAPSPGQQTIPINLGTSPAIVQIDQRLSRAIPFGPRVPVSPGVRGGPQPTRRPYSLELTAYAENILNKVNLSPPNGTLNSSLFGRSTSAQGPRVFTFGIDFTF